MSWHWFGAFAHLSRIPTTEDVAGLLTTLARYQQYAPTHWALQDGGVRLPYDESEILTALGDRDLYLERKKAPRSKLFLFRDRRPYLDLACPKDPSATSLHAAYELTADIAELLRPHACAFVGGPAPPMTDDEQPIWHGDIDRGLWLMASAAENPPVEYWMDGLRGLGARTYLGPEYVRQFGRDVLLSTPAVTAELGWGGIRVDLAEEPWALPDDELVRRWVRAMDHLRGAGVFAEEDVDDVRYEVRYRKGSRAVLPPVGA